MTNIYIKPFIFVLKKNLANNNIKYVQHDKKFFMLIKISIRILLKEWLKNSWIKLNSENKNKIAMDKYSFFTKTNLIIKIYFIIKNIVSFVDWIFIEDSS